MKKKIVIICMIALIVYCISICLLQQRDTFIELINGTIGGMVGGSTFSIICCWILYFTERWIGIPNGN